MWNVIKMDLYRMVRMKSFYVVLLILMFFFGSSIYLAIGQESFLEANPEEQQKVEDMASSNERVDIGMSVSTDVSAEEGTMVDWLKMNISAGLMFLLVTIFLVVFVCSEYSAGFLKNTVSQINNRAYLYIGKLVVSFVFIVVGYVAAVLSIILGSLIAIQTVNIGDWKDILMYCGMTLLIQWALSAIIIFFCTLTRSTAFSMVIGICISLNMFALVYMLIDKIAPSLHAFEYSLVNQLAQVPTVMAGATLSKPILLALVYAIVFSIANCALLNKIDVK